MHCKLPIESANKVNTVVVNSPNSAIGISTCVLGSRCTWACCLTRGPSVRQFAMPVKLYLELSDQIILGVQL